MFKRARNVVIKGGTFTASAGDTYKTVNNINNYSATQVISGSTLATDIPRREDRRTPPLVGDTLSPPLQQEWASVERGSAEIRDSESKTVVSDYSPSSPILDVNAPEITPVSNTEKGMSRLSSDASLHSVPASPSRISTKTIGSTEQHAANTNSQPPIHQEPFRQRLMEMLGTAYEGAERYRLEQDRIKAHHWKRWGPYLSDRQWVRTQLVMIVDIPSLYH